MYIRNKKLKDLRLNREITSNERVLICNLKQEGKTCKEISTALDISEMCVKDNLNQYMLSHPIEKLNNRHRFIFFNFFFKYYIKPLQ